VRPGVISEAACGGYRSVRFTVKPRHELHQRCPLCGVSILWNSRLCR
jgi:hypothetical protein